MNFDILATMSVAVLSSFSHCYAMCGGFNLAFLRLNSATNINPSLNLAPKNFEQNPNQNELNSAKTAQISRVNSAQNANNRSNFTRNLAQNSAPFALILTYHSFRIIAYTLLGVIFGAFGNVLAFLNKGVLFFALGVFMVLLALALNYKGKFLAFFENPFFFNAFAKKVWQKVKFKGYKSAVILGFCNGFVPCGLVYFFLALAMSQENLYQSAFIMLLFGLCTLPALLFFSEVARFLERRLGSKFQNLWTKISYLIIMLYGIYLAYLGLGLTR